MASRKITDGALEMGTFVGSANIEVKTLRKMLEKGEPVTVLDVRKAEARAERQIPGSVHFDTYDALKAKDPGAMGEAELPIELPVKTVSCAGNTSGTVPVPFDGEPVAAPLSGYGATCRSWVKTRSPSYGVSPSVPLQRRRITSASRS